MLIKMLLNTQMKCADHKTKENERDREQEEWEKEYSLELTRRQTILNNEIVIFANTLIEALFSQLSLYSKLYDLYVKLNLDRTNEIEQSIQRTTVEIYPEDHSGYNSGYNSWHDDIKYNDLNCSTSVKDQWRKFEKFENFTTRIADCVFEHCEIFYQMTYNKLLKDLHNNLSTQDVDLFEAPYFLKNIPRIVKYIDYESEYELIFNYRVSILNWLYDKSKEIENKTGLIYLMIPRAINEVRNYLFKPEITMFEAANYLHPEARILQYDKINPEYIIECCILFLETTSKQNNFINIEEKKSQCKKLKKIISNCFVFIERYTSMACFQCDQLKEILQKCQIMIEHKQQQKSTYKQIGESYEINNASRSIQNIMDNMENIKNQILSCEEIIKQQQDPDWRHQNKQKIEQYKSRFNAVLNLTSNSNTNEQTTNNQ
jgi:hypothetical protein